MSVTDPSLDGRKKRVPRIVPIEFLGEIPFRHLAVTEAGFRKLMSYDQLSPRAAQYASWKFRAMFGIRKLPGGVYYIEEIRRALDLKYELEKEKRLRKFFRKSGA